MIKTRRLLVAGMTAALVAALGACSDGGDDLSANGSVAQQSQPAQQAQPSPEVVHGLRDTVRHVTRKTADATRAHLVRKCTSTTERVRHTSRSGSGTRKTTRVWYTTEHHETCKKVRQGTERYKRVVRRERWCVSLDDVNGHKSQDDVWYRVDRVTYDQVLQADQHTRVEFTPAGTGC
ncbi:hypothetical protein ACFY1L_01115 [Streptomyces sp. NPDC001663]|uniref:hypothetical protein n=1 Tax=Streptomyces sp. NPDC001663 TaxID=3364597 RepID=UPI0036A35E1B